MPRKAPAKHQAHPARSAINPITAILIAAIVIIAIAVTYLAMEPNALTGLFPLSQLVPQATTSQTTTTCAQQTNCTPVTFATTTINYESAAAGNYGTGASVLMPFNYKYYICNGELVNLEIGRVSWEADSNTPKASIGHSATNWCNMTVSGGSDVFLVTGMAVNSTVKPSIFTATGGHSSSVTLSYNVTVPRSFTVIVVGNGGIAGNVTGVNLPAGCNATVERYGTPPPAPILSYFAVCNSQGTGVYRVTAYNGSATGILAQTLIGAYVFAPVNRTVTTTTSLTTTIISTTTSTTTMLAPSSTILWAWTAKNSSLSAGSSITLPKAYNSTYICSLGTQATINKTSWTPSISIVNSSIGTQSANICSFNTSSALTSSIALAGVALEGNPLPAPSIYISKGIGTGIYDLNYAVGPQPGLTVIAIAGGASMTTVNLPPGCTANLTGISRGAYQYAPYRYLQPFSAVAVCPAQQPGNYVASVNSTSNSRYIIGAAYVYPLAGGYTTTSVSTTSIPVNANYSCNTCYSNPIAGASCPKTCPVLASNNCVLGAFQCVQQSS